MTQKRLLFFFLVLLLIGTATFFLINFAKGYRFNFSQKTFHPSGLLVATSLPDGAQIFIDGTLKSATNTTLSLTPDTYLVEIKKEGYTPWKKTFKIEKEVVTKTEAWLFPLMPNLQSLTFTGVANPLLSPDGTKIVYQVNENLPEKNGLWVLDLSDLPFGITKEARQIVRSFSKERDFAQATYRWSPDSRQILVTFQNQPTRKKEPIMKENFLLDTSAFTSPAQFEETAKNQPITSLIKTQWEKEEELKQNQKSAKIHPQLAQFFKNNTQQLFFSPDETKILYFATSSATLPENLITPLPGSSTQLQKRQLEPNQIYVYDIKEDRNFLIQTESNCYLYPQLDLSQIKGKDFPACTLRWFPNSRHLFLTTKEKIQIGEYEGVNWSTVYAGSYQFPFAYPYPGANKLLILTNLANLADSSPNLFAVSLR